MTTHIHALRTNVADLLVALTPDLHDEDTFDGGADEAAATLSYVLSPHLSTHLDDDTIVRGEHALETILSGLRILHAARATAFRDATGG